MKKIFIILFGSCLLVTNNSCKKTLNVPPQNVILTSASYNNVKDLQAALMGAYDALQSGSVLNGDMVTLSELLSDEGTVEVASLHSFDKLEIYQMASTVQLLPIRNMWKDAYAAINRANTVIYYCNNPSTQLKADPNFATVKSLYIGEALFIRALMHLQLCRFWALPYDVTKKGGNTQLGIPIRTTPILSLDDDFNKARSSVEEVYAQIKLDCAESASLLATANYSSTYAKINGTAIRCSKWAPVALLARVNFMSGNYSDAANNASDVIASGSYSLADSSNYATIHTTTDNNKSNETIFQIYNSSLSGDGNNNLSYAFKSVSAGGFISIALSFLNNFTTGDIRKNNFSTTCNKYLGSGVINMSILRLSEMYVTYAEASFLADGNISTDALDKYNFFTSKRYLSANYIPETAASITLAKIQQERFLELAFEGDRLWNLKRMHLPIRNNVGWNDAKSIFKIPMEEINGNNLIVQNP